MNVVGILETIAEKITVSGSITWLQNRWKVTDIRWKKQTNKQTKLFDFRV